MVLYLGMGEFDVLERFLGLKCILGFLDVVPDLRLGTPETDPGSLTVDDIF